MYISLIVCTFKRPLALQRLLESVGFQSVYPNQIIIVDGSHDNETKKLDLDAQYQNLCYYKVNPEDRGLTRQRNFGIKKINKTSQIVCFVDDDTVLERDYFKNIVSIFRYNKDITGVGGVAINENNWFEKKAVTYSKINFYTWNSYVVKEALRNKIRNVLGLQSHLPPGVLPEFGHGRTCGYPLTGDLHVVDLLIGMSMSFRTVVLNNIKFSTYFEGYGLYEDADFSIRAQKFGKNVIATNVRLSHYHDPSGRPNQYKYGKMVVRNGYYIWRVKYPNPSSIAKIKWHVITLLLAVIRLSNVITTNKRKEAFTEFLGRIVGWGSLFFFKPINN